MRVLIAEDEPVSRRALEATLQQWGYDVDGVGDGGAALEALSRPDAPKLAILDWVMPGVDGPGVCRRVRGMPTAEPPYLMLLTAKEGAEHAAAGLDAGANDYITKPFHRAELRARLGVGHRVVELQAALAERVRELEAALADVKQLSGLLPICAYCKKIRDDRNYWTQLESYISDRSDARFSHGICPECYGKMKRT